MVGAGARRVPALLGARPALVLATAALALHLWVSAGYDYFGDELYFIVCGQHPDWGYVDQPPLVPCLAGAERWLFGDSLTGLRLIPTLAAAALTGLSAEAARRLGGGLFARWLTGLAVLLAPAFLGVAQTFSTDSLQPLAWLAATLLLMEAIERPRPAPWFWLGALVGVAFLDKYSIAFFLAAAASGLVLTPERRVMARPGPWIAAGLALLIALPNLIWQQVHGWPFLQLNARAISGRNIDYSPVGYLLQQILLIGPLAAPIWLAGLAGFAFWPRLAAMRWIAITWVALMAMMTLLHGKSYYPAGVYPILLAGGAVVIEAGVRSTAARAAIGASVFLGGAVLAPFVSPVMPVERFIAYEQAIGHAAGLSSRTAALDNQPLGVLPANYASMFGYREIAAAVGRAYQALPPRDRAQAVFFGRSYAEAAAVEVFGGPWGSPPAISGHNNYFLWGPRGHDGAVVLLLTSAPRAGLLQAYGPSTIGTPEAMRAMLLRIYASVEPVAQIDPAYAQPIERGLTLWLCRGRKTSLEWASLKHFD
jgi:4-amino-4-deoxy-L-arabinose transferase-like glycosyltransferase